MKRLLAAAQVAMGLDEMTWKRALGQSAVKLDPEVHVGGKEVSR